MKDKRRSFSLFQILLLAALVIPVVLPYTPVGGPWKDFCVSVIKAMRKPSTVVEEKRVEVMVDRPVEVEKEVIREVVKEVEKPDEPLPSKYVERKEVDVATLYNGIKINTELQTSEGGLASVEREKDDSFRVDFSLNLRIPKANQSLEDLQKINPDLGKMLPGLAAMLQTGRVSGFYYQMYENKTTRIQRDLTRLNKVLDKHNFFDTETVMELTNPAGGKVLLIQSEMDVVSDGSDGDRMPDLSDYITMSDYYQPFTSYSWPKKTDTPNPLLARWQDNLKKYETEFAVKGLSAERNQFLKDAIEEHKRGISSMKTTSWLIAEKDPFIVMSLAMVNQTDKSPFAPLIGDYAVVIHGNKIFPTIVGDAGPSFKNGEASLFLAKTINEKATPFRRPESDLKVTYLVFPNSREKPFGPPDLVKWREKCQEYLKGMGGLGEGFVLHEWENPFAPPEVPPVEPAPDPAPTEPVPAEPAPSTPATPPTTTTPAP